MTYLRVCFYGCFIWYVSMVVSYGMFVWLPGYPQSILYISKYILQVHLALLLLKLCISRQEDPTLNDQGGRVQACRS